jgi:hypothetical protein
VWPCKTIAGGLRARVEGTKARPPGHRRARTAALAVVLAATIGVPVALAAETQLDGSPIDVWTNGVGQMQFRYDGFADGVFFSPESNTPHAGLAIVAGDTVFPVGSGNLVRGPTEVAKPDGSRALDSTYTFGSPAQFEVMEDVAYKNGTQTADVSYSITNLAGAPVSFRVGLLADLFIAGQDEGNAVFTGAAPNRFIGGQSAAGTVSGLTEITPWSHYQEGQYSGADDVFDAFYDTAAAGLRDSTNPAYVDNEVGVQWDRTLGPSGVTTIATRWTLGPPPPPPQSATPTPTPVPTVTPTPAVTTLPPPVAGKSVNLKLARGKVLYKVPGTNKFLPLTADVQVPVGTTLDTVNGRVTLTSASDLKGGTNHAWFYEGVFKVGQTKSAKPITELALAGDKPSCKKAKSSASAAAKKKTRRLWGDGSGQFRTRGQFSSATVRGTKWVVQDQCNGTLTRVVRGAVTVRDFSKRKTVIVRAGKQYLARAKKK